MGFAAETHDLEAEARRKLKEKHLDLIVANEVTRQDAGFAVDTNQVTILSPQGQPKRLPLLSKDRGGRTNPGPGGGTLGESTVMNNRHLICSEETFPLLPFAKEWLKSPPLQKGDLGGFEVFALRAVR